MAAQPRPASTAAVGTAPGGAAAERRFRVALEFAVEGDLRFLSHHDELRMLARALVRARWPVAYTQGYNPLPRLVLPLPRSLGIAAAAQLALVDLEGERPTEELFHSLHAALPAGYRLQRVVPAAAGMPHARAVTYEVALDPEDVGPVQARLPRLLDRTTWVVERSQRPGKPTQHIDIRPYIREVELEGRVLRLHLAIESQRTARPAEILTELGLTAETYNHRVRRVAVQWDIELAGPTAARVSRKEDTW